MHLAHFMQLVDETNQCGYGKYYGIMNLTSFQCCKDILKMLKWSSGIPLWIFCSLVVMTTLLRSGQRMGTVMIGIVFKLEVNPTVWASSFSANGDKMVSSSDDLTVRVWGADIMRMQLADGNAPWEGIIASGAADDAIRLFVESEDGLENTPLASASDDGKVKIWRLNASSGNEKLPL
ncbi:unnamed protein product [Fraxinus pennsylvanica]|uniref:Uncharacterized protein n=1 Tax=Fraxinus pennsylvanica TaxID=56036 RepID=A0AAD1Z3C4_9LAMI|nr:unnamed protein product [Fraxinus pennsylvanica]